MGTRLRAAPCLISAKMKTVCVLGLLVCLLCCKAQSQPALRTPPLCLPQLFAISEVRVHVTGAHYCPESDSKENNFTLFLIDQIINGPFNENCSIVGTPERVFCQDVGRRNPKTRLTYSTRVTCNGPCAPYTNEEEGRGENGKNQRELREQTTEKLSLQTTYEGNDVQIAFFRGRKETRSVCPAGVYGSIKEKTDVCICPDVCRELICDQPPEPGLCLAFFPRWFYNATSMECEQFIYGGCGGNKNNFETFEDCQERCEECPEGKIYKTCGTACPRTCANRDENMFCTTQCVPGCFCPDGYMELGDKCVRREQCPDICDLDPVTGPCRAVIPRWFHNSTSDQCEMFTYGGCMGNDNNFRTERECQRRCSDSMRPQCPGDKVFSSCGSLCPLNCGNMDDPPVCSTLCVEGCFCPEGTIEMGNRCVKPADCPRTDVECPRGKIFQDCGSACPPRCDNIDEEVSCNTQCITGCFCRRGSVELAGGCVRREECPVCRGDKIFRECGSNCTRSCSNLHDDLVCTDQCVAGCYCSPGYIEHQDRCVRPSECRRQQECPEGKVYKQCGTACPLTCENKDDPDPRICTLQCVQGCFCQDGLVELGDSECVRPEECPVECPEGKVYKECGTACPLTCGNKDDPPVCTFQCVKDCFCPEGQVLMGEECVTPGECPDVNN